MCGKYVGHASVKNIKNKIYSANAKEIKIIKVIIQFITNFPLKEIWIDFSIIRIPTIIGIIPYK